MIIPHTHIYTHAQLVHTHAHDRFAQEGKPRTFEDLETDLLKGQKLQGVLTSNEVQEILKVRGEVGRRAAESAAGKGGLGRCIGMTACRRMVVNGRGVAWAA